jgi:geranylgeranyl diphosphate synthase, type I
VTSTTTDDAAIGWELLTSAKQEVDSEIRQAVERLGEPVRTVAAYHFGWETGADDRAHSSGGKSIRAALVLASARAAGGSPERAAKAAAAVELAHNCSLLHDDIMDGDLTRRGRPSAWVRFGNSQAILAGDALLVLAFDILCTGLPRPACSEMSAELSASLLALADGQGADLSFEERSDVNLGECMAMAAGKTAALFAGACALGALAADGGPVRVDCLRSFGHHLGIAFQMVDDLLGIWGDPKLTGKPVGSDLRSRKKSLPIVAAISSGLPAGIQLRELLLGMEPMRDEEVDRAARLVEEAGGRTWVSTEAASHRSRALSFLAAARPEPEAARALISLADLITNRDR